MCSVNLPYRISLYLIVYPFTLSSLGMMGRVREVSSDSCESLANNPVKNSPMSPVSENRTLGSPAVGSLSSPGSTLESEFKKQQINHGPPDIEAIRPFQSNERIQRNMESQLMNEIKDKSANEDFANDASNNGSKTNTPAAMLVSELFESFKAKSSVKPPGATQAAAPPSNPEPDSKPDFKVNLRKVKKPDDAKEESNNDISAKGHQIDFKSNLKKTSSEMPAAPSKADTESNIVDFKAKLKKPTKSIEVAKDDTPTEPMDFKSRLRKVSGSKGQSPTKENEATPPEKRDSITSTDSEAAAALDDKRKSTGSISSLRKMWESSPKPLRTHPPTDLDKTVTTPTGDDGIDKQSTVKFEKRVWPPVPNTETEKPMVPVKPTVKPPAPTTKPPPPKEPLVKPPPKPAMAVKPNVCNIYAAPTIGMSLNL